jgi:phosphoribosyl-dephospho-CoA transferase
MATLRRHQLAYLGAEGWQAVLRGTAASPHARQLEAWAARGLPLVVTMQPCTGAAHDVALGWAAPPSPQRARVGLRVPVTSIAWLDEFPPAVDAVPLGPRGTRAAIRSMLEAIQAIGTTPRVYGSCGWQLLSGLEYVHDLSDLDIWMAVHSVEQADAIVALLDAQGSVRPRVDGELLLPDGSAVAWREYAAWRAGRTRSVLVKRLDGTSVEQRLALTSRCEAAVQ